MTKTGWYAALTFTGTLLGAGFGSGQELWQFFARFGLNGVMGVLLAAVLFMLLAAGTIYVAVAAKCQNHRDFFQAILPMPLAKVADILLCFYLLAGTGIMFAAAASMADEYLGFSPWFGIIALLIPTFLVVVVQTEGVFLCQKVLVPLLIFGILTVAFCALRLPPEPLSHVPSGFAWAGSSILYVSYNMLGGLAILVGLTNAEKTPLQPRVGRVGGILVGILALLPVCALIQQGQTVGRYDLPLLYLAYRQSSALFYLYGGLFAAALLTTTIANSYCLCRRFASPKRPWPLVLLVVLALAIPLSLGDFPSLIGIVYRGCGILGLFLLPPLAWRCWQIARKKV